jgi:hypothetical protein
MLRFIAQMLEGHLRPKRMKKKVPVCVYTYVCMYVHVYVQV